MRRFLAIVILSLACIGSGDPASKNHEYKIFTGDDLRKNLIIPEEMGLFSPEKAKPGVSALREPLPIKRDYSDSPDAQAQFEKIMNKLQEDLHRQPSYKYLCTEQNVKMLINFIKKYSDTSQGLTAKMTLGIVVGDPWLGDTIPSHYWAFDIFGEIYKEFPDSWQSKVGLYYMYRNIFWPSCQYQASWSNIYVDELEKINWELESMFLADKPDKWFINYNEYYWFNVKNHWHYMPDIYCQASSTRWSKENGKREYYIDKSKEIYQHIYYLCYSGKNCPYSNPDMEFDHLRKHSKVGTYDAKCIPEDFKLNPEEGDQ